MSTNQEVAIGHLHHACVIRQPIADCVEVHDIAIVAVNQIQFTAAIGRQPHVRFVVLAILIDGTHCNVERESSQIVRINVSHTGRVASVG